MDALLTSELNPASAPSRDSEFHPVGESGGLFSQTGAADPASPVRRRSGPLGGQGDTCSEQPWRPK